MPETNIWETNIKYDPQTLHDQERRAENALFSIDKTGNCEPWDGLLIEYQTLTLKPGDLTEKEVKRLAQVKHGLVETFGKKAPNIYSSWKSAQAKRVLTPEPQTN